MRATLTTVSVVALLAAGAGTASARPDPETGRADAGIGGALAAALLLSAAGVSTLRRQQAPATR